MEFILAGKRFNIATHDIDKEMRGQEPEMVRTHAVRLSGKLFPVKQVVSVVTGLSKADFNSHQAHQILRRLDLDVVTIPVKKGTNKK